MSEQEADAWREGGWAPRPDGTEVNVFDPPTEGGGVGPLWFIVDGQTGRRATVGAFFSEASAQATITSWLDRHDRGGRSDITRDALERLVAVPDPCRHPTEVEAPPSTT